MNRDRVAAGMVVGAVVDGLAAAFNALEFPVEVAARGGEGSLGDVVVVVSLPLGDAARLAVELTEWEAAGG